MYCYFSSCFTIVAFFTCFFFIFTFSFNLLLFSFSFNNCSTSDSCQGNISNVKFLIKKKLSNYFTLLFILALSFN